jgi:ribosomal protein S18 acetylase RimI-like enzyme
MRIRPARLEDAEAAAALLLELPGGLTLLFRRREDAERIGRAVFTGSRTVLSHRFGLVAEDGGRILGLMTRLPGRLWRRLRVPTGMAMIRAAGAAQAPGVVFRGRVQDRLIPAVSAESLYLPALSIVADRRGQGIGTSLLLRAFGEAAELGLRAVTLDVDADDATAIKLYLREGFEKISEQQIQPTRGMPHMASLRMERLVGRRD